MAAEVLVARPNASLADVAKAAGIGRTTLHKHYPTRQDLLVAVAHDSLDRCDRAIATALEAADEDPVTVLHHLVERLVPLGPQLQFLFRQPTLDDEPKVMRRMSELEPPLHVLVRRAKEQGQVRADIAEWWFVSALYGLLYTAWEGVAYGWLAARDAPDLVVRTLLEGIGQRA